MARTRNEDDYNKKKEQILINAINLLSDIGYEKFSINKVIESSGHTKGAFFHYYKSKKELIEGIMNIILVPMVKEFTHISNDENLNPRQKIKVMFKTAASMKNIEDKMIKELANLLYKEENQMILYLVTKDILKLCIPLYENIMIEGCEKEYFDIKNPHGAAFMFLNTLIALNEAIGRTMFSEDVDVTSWIQLRDKLSSFELYAKEMFQFEEEINLYGSDMFDMIDMRIRDKKAILK